MLYTSDVPLTTIQTEKKRLFLAGSIDLELPGNWRKFVAHQLDAHFDFFDPTAANHQTLTKLEWKQHIKWELDAMDKADVILLNFLPAAKSPISLVELGLNASGEKLIVVCPDEFYKKQYVTELCEHCSTPLFSFLKEAIDYIENNLCKNYTN